MCVYTERKIKRWEGKKNAYSGWIGQHSFLGKMWLCASPQDLKNKPKFSSPQFSLEINGFIGLSCRAWVRGCWEECVWPQSSHIIKSPPNQNGRLPYGCHLSLLSIAVIKHKPVYPVPCSSTQEVANTPTELGPPTPIINQESAPKDLPPSQSDGGSPAIKVSSSQMSQLETQTNSP